MLTGKYILLSLCNVNTVVTLFSYKERKAGHNICEKPTELWSMLGI